jgi:hypothetical protein
MLLQTLLTTKTSFFSQQLTMKTSKGVLGWRAVLKQFYSETECFLKAFFKALQKHFWRHHSTSPHELIVHRSASLKVHLDALSRILTKRPDRHDEVRVGTGI